MLYYLLIMPTWRRHEKKGLVPDWSWRKKKTGEQKHLSFPDAEDIQVGHGTLGTSQGL